MGNTLERLKEATKHCRPDMHEPDEVGISAIVSGYNLDNAMGDDPHDNKGELTIGIKDSNSENRYDSYLESYEWFNLATLIALARKADLRDKDIKDKDIKDKALDLAWEYLTCKTEERPEFHVVIDNLHKARKNS